MKKVRSSQASIWINSSTELNKTQAFPVTIVKSEGDTTECFVTYFSF